jgi:hypothetical protein
VGEVVHENSIAEDPELFNVSDGWKRLKIDWL